MIALRFLDIETNVVDALGEIEIQHLLRRLDALLRQNRDDVEGHSLLLQHVKAGNGLIESTPSRACHTMSIVQMLGSIDTHAHADVPPLEELTPRRSDQHAIRLNRMPQFQGSGPQPFDRLESLLVKGNRHHQRFAGMPDDGKAVARPAVRKYFLEQI